MLFFFVSEILWKIQLFITSTLCYILYQLFKAKKQILFLFVEKVIATQNYKTIRLWNQFKLMYLNLFHNRIVL